MDGTSDAYEPRLAGELGSLLDGSLDIEDFIAAIVHESNQPLVAIQMLVGALRDAGDSMPAEERARLLDGIGDQARFLCDLSNWMLQPFAREVVVFDELVEREVDRCRLIATDHVLVVSPATDGLIVNCERPRVEASLRNLICNAVRNSPAGSTITITTSRHGDSAVVNVRDEGSGIPEAEWERIFEPNVRLDPESEGAGLGLAIVRSCADRHGGTVHVDASTPAGTTMEFAIPVMA
ncbi:MAG: HAMP domain-containing histidine kinase [Actinobacteria bacterium]|nr:HAMP domain-containing histidine kinase [Actinomycetota bacterium]